METEIERVRPRLRQIRLLDLDTDGNGSASRSTALWRGLTQVEADAFGILDDDDALHPNHVATLLPLAMLPGPGVAYSGSIRVWEALETLGFVAKAA
ncbi:hypothetical protein GCM10022293_05360 [Azospirillum formosense]